MADKDLNQGLSEEDIDALLDAGAAGGAEHEDPLLADFDDLLADAGAPAPAPAPAPAAAQPAPAAQGTVGEEVSEDDLAELDAFLDEFGEQLEGEAQQQPAAMAHPEPAEELWADAEPVDDVAVIPAPPMEPEGPVSAHEEVAGALASLSAEDLSLDDEPIAPPPPAPAAPEPAEDLFTPSARARELAAMMSPPPSREAPLVSERAPEPPAPAAPAVTPAPAAAADRRPLFAAAAAVVGALLGGGGLWMASGVGSEVAQLNTRVEQLRTRAAGSGANPEVAAQVEQLAADVRQVKGRVDQLSVLLEGPMSHLRESNTRDIQGLQERVDQTEKLVSALQQNLAALAQRKPAPVPADRIPAAPAQAGVAAAPQQPPAVVVSAAPVPQPQPPAKSEPPPAKPEPVTPKAEPPKPKPEPQQAKPEPKAKPKPEPRQAAKKPPAAKPQGLPQPTGGDWVVNLESLSSETLANDQLAAYRRRGVQAEKQVAEVEGKTWYRLRVSGFASREAAGDYARQLKGRFRVSPWLSREA